MRVTVTGFTDGKKIHAIKGIRSATGLGLKEAKDVADYAAAGTPTVIDLAHPDDLRELDEHGVIYSKVGIAIGELIAALEDYPAGLRVGDLVRVLRVVEAQA